MTNFHHGDSTAHGILHIVKPNDTFYDLARTYHTTVQSIAALNPSANPRNLQIGTALLIQPGPTWRDTTSTTRNNQTTSLVWPNRVHPIERPSTPPTQPNPAWPIFDNTSLPQTRTQSLDPNRQGSQSGSMTGSPSGTMTGTLMPSTRPVVPGTPVAPMPMPTAQIMPQPLPGTIGTMPLPGNMGNIPQPLPGNIGTMPAPLPGTIGVEPIPGTPISPVPIPTVPGTVQPLPGNNINPLPMMPTIPVAPIPLPDQSIEHCNQSSLCSQMRMLLAQQVYWTRMLLNSIVDRTQQLNANTQRLMQNPVDMGQLYARSYGNQAGQQVSNLYSQNLAIGKEFMTSLRDRRNTDIDRLRRMWYTSADDITQFLSNLVPDIDAQTLRQMLYQNLGNTELQTTQQLANNTTSSINTFDNIETDAMHMADYLSNAILNDNLNR